MINTVDSADALADKLGVAQKGGDNAEDSKAIPQGILGGLIGKKAKRQGLLTSILPAPVAAPLKGTNGLVDGLLGDADQIANVCLWFFFVAKTIRLNVLLTLLTECSGRVWREYDT